eukprot:363070-Chlamydomonas_euryale.AAC.1
MPPFQHLRRLRQPRQQPEQLPLGMQPALPAAPHLRGLFPGPTSLPMGHPHVTCSWAAAAPPQTKRKPPRHAHSCAKWVRVPAAATARRAAGGPETPAASTACRPHFSRCPSEAGRAASCATSVHLCAEHDN